MKKNWIGLLILLAIVGYGVYDYLDSSQKKEASEPVVNLENVPKGIKKGHVPPNLTLKDLNGNPVSLSDYRGKTVYLNFWATWCPPCRAEMPHMEQFYNDFKKDGVEVLAVNLTETEKNRDDVPAFVKEFGLTFPVLMDEESEGLVDFKVMAYPTTYVIDKNGIIAERFQGAIDYDIMTQVLSGLK